MFRCLAGALCVATLALASLSQPVCATESLVPGYRTSRILFRNVTVVVEPGRVLTGRTVTIDGGVIADVSASPAEDGAARVIEDAGLWVYAGFVDAGNEGLLKDVSVEPARGRPVPFNEYALAQSRWDNRKGLTPEFTMHRVAALPEPRLEELRRSGFVAAHVVPRGRIANGFSALLITRALPVREALLNERVYSVFELKALGGGDYPQTLMGATARLRQAFLDAQFWARLRTRPVAVRLAQGWPSSDPTLETLHQVLRGTYRCMFRAAGRDDVFRALKFAREFDLNAAVLTDGSVVTVLEDMRRLGRVGEFPPVVLRLDFPAAPKIEQPAATTGSEQTANATKSDAEGSPDDRQKRTTGEVASARPAGGGDTLRPDAPPPLRVQRDRLRRWKEQANAAKELSAAGIAVALGTGSLEKSGDVLAKIRELVRQGVPADIVLAGLTTNAANLLGADKLLGRVQRGRPAFLTVFDGPFEKDSSKLRFVVIGDAVFEFNKPKGGEASKQGGSSAKDPGGSPPGRLSAARPSKTESRRPMSGGAELAGRIEPSQARAERPGARQPQAGSRREAHAPESDPPTELAHGRQNPEPRTGGNVFVRAGTIWTGTGQTLRDAAILIRGGKIVAIGRGLKPPADVTIIDATGRFVMPGIIDTHSHIMISGGVNEATQSIVCECRIGDVVRSDDVSEFRALAGGVTTARLLHGSANTIGGQDAVVKLKHGRTADEHLMSDQSHGVKFALGENVKYRRSRFPNTRLGVAALLERAFSEADRYRKVRSVAESSGRPFRRDLRLETLADILEHRKWIHSHCYRADEILMLLRTAESLGIRVQSLQHVLEGYKVAPEIASHGASCSTFADWWAYKVEAYDAIPHNAALLHEAGVNAVIKSDDAELIRHLYQEAAKTVRYGCMPPDAALQAITVNPARELRLLHRIGTLEVGKDGDLGIFNGHPLDAFARCEMTIIEGEVYFNRSHHPSAMTATMKQRTSEPRRWRPAEPNRERVEGLAKRLAAETRKRSFALVGATVHPVDGADVADGVVVVRDGRIAAVGKRDEVSVPDGVPTVDVRGLHVFPAIIDAGTTLGLTEIGKVVETHDYDESGTFQPDLVAAAAVNRDSELVPVARAGGVALFLTRPTAGLVAGRVSLMQAHGWTAEEMTVRRVCGLQVRWPSGSESARRIEQLDEWFAQARRYDAARSQQTPPADGRGAPRKPPANESAPLVDPRYEALRPFVRGEALVFVEADSRKQIAEAVLFAERHRLKIVICGGTDAWKLASALKSHRIPVIVGPVMRRPVEDFDPSDAPYANPGRLHEAGVAFCIRSDSAANSRNAPFEAAMAVAFGLPESAAVRAVTLSAAEILGVAEQTGSITPGKRADLVITDGSILQPTSHVLLTIVDGVAYAPESRQTRFYQRYRRRVLEWKAARGR